MKMLIESERHIIFLDSSVKSTADETLLGNLHSAGTTSLNCAMRTHSRDCQDQIKSGRNVDEKIFTYYELLCGERLNARRTSRTHAV